MLACSENPLYSYILTISIVLPTINYIENLRRNCHKFSTRDKVQITRGYSVDIGVVADRKKGANVKKEIDFVVNKGDRRVYIQSAWQMNTTEKITAELDSLKLAKDFFAKIIIQNDIPSYFSDDDGIIHCNLIEFLLHPELIPL